jgi:hypothetical protein
MFNTTDSKRQRQIVTGTLAIGTQNLALGFSLPEKEFSQKVREESDVAQLF